MFFHLDSGIEHTNNFIQKTIFHLHPTFNPNKVTLEKAPFSFTRIGWGYFTIRVEVQFQKWTGLDTMQLDHTLCFEGEGKSGRVTIEMPKDAILKNANAWAASQHVVAEEA